MNTFQICTLRIKTQDKPREGWGSLLRYCILTCPPARKGNSFHLSPREVVLGEAQPLAEGCLVPAPVPESTEKVRFVFINFCLPSGIPSASEGGASASCSHQGGERIILPACVFPLALLERAPGIKQDSSPSPITIFTV